MSIPPYGEYKDSGAPWLEQVPAHWELSRISARFTERRKKVSDVDYPPLSVTKNGIVPQLETAAKTDDNDNRKCVLAGDFVINSRSDRKGSSGLSSLDGSVSLINTVIEPDATMHGLFVHHLFRSVAFQEEYYRYGKGIVADLWSTNYGEMKAITLAVPPMDEQEAIATFLDRETAKIDALVAEQKRLIALLKEKRQAVISKAVTKGLDPDAPIKDSGIEWLGEIPAHWEVMALKHACSMVRDGTHQPPPRIDDGVPLLSVRNVQNDRFTFLTDDSQISREDYDDLARSFVPMEGDVLLAIVGATLGKAAVIEQGMSDFHIQRSLGIFRPKATLRSEWLHRTFRSTGFQRLLWNNVGYSAQPGIYLGALANFRVAVPPRSEQDQILEELQPQEAALEGLLDEALQAITLLKERRAAVISAAVTGKIDVRGLVEQHEMEAA